MRSTEMTYGRATAELRCSLLFTSLPAFIYLFRLHWASLLVFSSCGERGLHWVSAGRGFSLAVVSGAYSFVMMRRLLTAAASLVVEHGLWDLPRPGIKPMSPAWAGRFLATGPPERSCLVLDVHGGLRGSEN